MQQKTVLVTGASSGIGKDFCEIFASKGYRLVLTARRKAKLEENAAYLKKKHNTSSYIFSLDLAKKEAPLQLYNELKKNQINIDILINNAGYSLKKSFKDNSWQEIEDLLNVLAISATRLCHQFLPGMVLRNYGRIINVASVAAFTPETPGSLYIPLKAYMVSLSKALAKEYTSNNIHITALCPGLTYTEFHDVLGNRKEIAKIPKPFWMDSQTVARQGYKAVMSGRTVYINGNINRFICLILKVFPHLLFSKIKTNLLKRQK